MESAPLCELLPVKFQTADLESHHCALYALWVFMLLFFYEESLDSVALDVT